MSIGQPNATHASELRSWVEAANQPGADFPIQNLPLGVVHRDPGSEPRIGVAIGDAILDLGSAGERGLLSGLSPALAEAVRAPRLNPLMSLDPAEWSALRAGVSALLAADATDRSSAEGCLIPMAGASMLLPCDVGDYTDFYASIDHATNVGTMFRPDQPLLPNYKWVPVGYHGRASSLVVSGTPVPRPSGQLMEDDAPAPRVGPSRFLDYECEVGVFVGGANPLGEPVPLARAPDRIFGFCLLNDWSARDIQKWEYQPLGPFLAKSFATSLSPWVVTAEALLPFRCPPRSRGEGDPAPLPYLSGPEDGARGGIDIRLEVLLRSERMRRDGVAASLVSRSRFADLYWTVAQLLTHHASNGCNLRPGDLLGSGTVSGPEPTSRGCLLERTWRGTEPFLLPTGEERRFLADGDEVILRGRCERPGAVGIGFGVCRGTIAGGPT